MTYEAYRAGYEAGLEKVAAPRYVKEFFSRNHGAKNQMKYLGGEANLRKDLLSTYRRSNGIPRADQEVYVGDYIIPSGKYNLSVNGDAYYRKRINKYPEHAHGFEYKDLRDRKKAELLPAPDNSDLEW